MYPVDMAILKYFRSQYKSSAWYSLLIVRRIWKRLRDRQSYFNINNSCCIFYWCKYILAFGTIINYNAKRFIEQPTLIKTICRHGLTVFVVIIWILITGMTAVVVISLYKTTYNATTKHTIFRCLTWPLSCDYIQFWVFTKDISVDSCICEIGFAYSTLINYCSWRVIISAIKVLKLIFARWILAFSDYY